KKISNNVYDNLNTESDNLNKKKDEVQQIIEEPKELIAEDSTNEHSIKENVNIIEEDVSKEEKKSIESVLPKNTFTVSFEEMELDDRLKRACARLKYKKPTLVQQTSIPLALMGKDIVARAKTGSGKTAAFCLPILQKILQNNTNLSITSEHALRALVLVPSKELANQVYDVLKSLSFYCQNVVRLLNACDCDGSLKSENPDIVVATPTKFLQLIDSQDTLESLVIDEADLILSFGYEEDLNKLVNFFPKALQTFLFSATLSCDVDRLKVLLVRNPAIIKLEDADEEDLLTQYSLRCTEQEKFLITYFLLKLKVHPFGTGKSLIFVNDIDRGYRLKLFLEQFAIKSCVLNSELPFKSRHHIVQEFNRGLYDYLIATDEVKNDEIDLENEKKVKKKGDKEFGVARGIDFINVQSVINFDFPGNFRGYLHRIGRTARGVGNKGYALSLIEKKKIIPGDNSKKVDLSPTKEEATLLKIQKKQQKIGREILDFNLDMTQVNGFRYRIEDALRIVTKTSVRDARLKEIRNEILNSEKLKAHFEDNPRDLEALRHDKQIHPQKILNHMKHIPTYLAPTKKTSIISKNISSSNEPVVTQTIANDSVSQQKSNGKKRNIEKVKEEDVGIVKFDATKQGTRKNKNYNVNKKLKVDSLKSFSVNK
ncbi:ATP-dependent DNA/RNA helicase, partial [Clydaea vesicula]